jgi:hypothetical protein
MAVAEDTTKPYCTCIQLKGTGWHLGASLGEDGEQYWLHSACEKPSIANWAARLNGVHIQYHVFYGGYLPEDEAFALRVVVDPVTRRDFIGYAPTSELKTSVTNPDIVARVWRWIGEE